MFSGHLGVGEAILALIIFELFPCFVGVWWTVFRRKPFPWKRTLIGMAGLWLLLLIASFFGC